MVSSFRSLLTALMLTGVPVVLPLLVASLDAQAPAANAITTAGPPAAPVRIERLVDRVWVAEAGDGAAPGSLYVFLSDNVLVISPREGSPSLWTWAEEVDGLVMTQRGRSTRITVVELTAERLRLRLATPKAPTEITFTAAIKPPAPPPAPSAPETGPAAGNAPASAAPPAVSTPIGPAYRCGADIIRVAFDGSTAYVTWPDNSVLVLKETPVAGASPSRRTYSDGQYRVVEDTSEASLRVLFSRPGFRPRPCTPTR